MAEYSSRAGSKVALPTDMVAAPLSIVYDTYREPISPGSDEPSRIDERLADRREGLRPANSPPAQGP
jgi:hypothetical protein